MNLDIKKVDLTNTNQKIFAGILLIATLYGLYTFLPPLIIIMQNLLIAGCLLAVLVFLALNYHNIWMLFTQLSWNITKGLIGGDKLGYMWRWHEYLLIKLEDLNKSIETVGAIRVRLTRRISELKANISENSKKHIQYTQNDVAGTVLRTLQNRVDVDNKQLQALLPQVVNVEKQENSLKELYDNMKADTEDLKYTLEAKATEYQLAKELDSAFGSALPFLGTNNKEYKMYLESLKQIENSVTQYTANAENFERKMQPLLQNLSAERQVSEDEGLKLIEEYKQNAVSLRLA